MELPRLFALFANYRSPLRGFVTDAAPAGRGDLLAARQFKRVFKTHVNVTTGETHMKTAGLLAIATLGILAVSARAQAQTGDTIPASASSPGQQIGVPSPMPPMPPDEAV